MQSKRVYAVATAHLDTVWRWNLAKTIDKYIPDTLLKNFNLIDKYPQYIFNFEGAFRYELIDEYYPAAFSKIKRLVKDGKWYPSGASYENGDVNIPSPEALIRNIMLGNEYFYKNFGVKSKDIFLPDCFGFGYALPAVMRHCNIYGFTTQKLSWGSAYGQPFDLGIWQGVDGSKVFACLDAKSYRYKFSGDIRGDASVIDKIARNAVDSSIAETLHLYGDGDCGGSPDEESVKSVCDSIKLNENSDFEVISSQSDSIYNDLENANKAIKNALPLWDNELLMTSHGAGGYTSRAMSKRLNRKCEETADIAERALTAADMLGVYSYPSDIMDKAWKRVIRHQFHDDIPGTSIMDVYNESWNDYALSLSQFISEYTGAVSAIANKLDTSWVTECAVIVNNPAQYKTTDAVSAHIKLNHNSTYIKVVDKNGNEVPSQIINKKGKEFDIIFLPTVSGCGYRVYDVQASDAPCSINTQLSVSEHTIENSKYRIVFNKNGDIASLIDKKLNKQLLSSPIKMAVLHDTGELNYPSWEIRKSDVDSEPYLYANSPVFEITENGPARCAVKVTRQCGYSAVEQTISLSADSDFIRVHNYVDWQTRRSMMKAMFPFSCYNNEATYDLGLGVITRQNNSEKLYEVPAQKWADITADDGAYGVSILSDSKYGWDKPNGNTLRLTCMHTPAGAFIKEARQDLQDIGRNIFDFGIFSHKTSWQNGTQSAAERFSKPLAAFMTTAKRKGELTDCFEPIKLEGDGVAIRAFKKSINGGYTIRVNETHGVEKKNISISLYKDITEAYDAYGDEKIKSAVNVKRGKIEFSLSPFEIKTFIVKTKADKKQPAENFKKIQLQYNTRGITCDSDMRNVILQGGGCSLPRELLPKDNQTVIAGITFKTAADDGTNDLLVTRAQTIDIPKGMTKLYFLAASTLGDRDAVFTADGKQRKIKIHSMTEPIFKWDMAGLGQTADVKNAVLGYEFTHCHHPEGNKADQKVYFYMYELNVRNTKTLKLPDDNRIIILAMTAVKKFSSTVLATDLSDHADSGYTFGEIPPIDKMIDKADFITIRAGKIQDQAKSGKGKGIKRSNPITNIIRSYTKSEW